MSDAATELCRKIQLHATVAERSGRRDIADRLANARQWIEERETDREAESHIAGIAQADAEGLAE